MATTQQESTPNVLAWKPEAKLGYLVAGDIVPLWLEQLQEQPNSKVEIDLTEVTSVDTTGLNSLVNLIEAAYKFNPSAVVINTTSSHITNMLELISLDLLCTIKQVKTD